MMSRKLPDSRPPKPDALLTIVSQLERLHGDWERAINLNNTSHSRFEEGQRDAWRQAQRQVTALIESIKAARASGIYLTDAQAQLVALIEDRHKTTMHFLQTIQRRIVESLLPKEEPQDGPAGDSGTAL